ncbi:MAG: hypothetical protein ABR571_17490 [Jatrophihabitans sp.]|uniref:hypothetical protein n=1 Tax=Jatrophihabitans sp. TaxID=1932789 RepID=UPI00390ECEC5
MKRNSDSSSVLDLVASYAPNEKTISAEWSSAAMRDTLASIVGNGGSALRAEDAGPVHDIPLHFLPTASRRRRPARFLPVAAAVAIIALITGIVAAVAGTSHRKGAVAGGTVGAPFDPPAGLSTATPNADQYYHQVDEQLELDAAGKVKPDAQDAMVNRNYVSATGEITSIRTGSQNVCYRFGVTTGSSWEQPTRAFFAALPTDVDALQTYLRNHVEGSSSHDEAVFVAVGDALRTAGGLASAKLRAAMLAVLSRTPGVVLHLNAQDYLDRPAIRADFVDQQIRPGEVHAYYFDPTDFRFLEERFAHNGEPSTHTGPSPAYEATTGPGDDPDVFTGAAFVDVIRSVEVVDHLPTLPSDCKTA